MADYANLLATIAANIYTNNNNEVTAAMVKTTVDQMVASLGDGYQFAGVATPASDPNNPDEQQFYIAWTPGTYTNFGYTMNIGEIAIFYGSGTTWSKISTSMLKKTASVLYSPKNISFAQSLVKNPIDIDVVNKEIHAPARIYLYDMYGTLGYVEPGDYPFTIPTGVSGSFLLFADMANHEMSLVWNAYVSASENLVLLGTISIRAASGKVYDDQIPFYHKINGVTYDTIIPNGATGPDLRGKKLSILGDSISSYAGYIPAGNLAFYPRTGYDVNDVSKTWWSKLLAKTGMVLEMNESWSASRIATPPPGRTEKPFTDPDRYNNLGSPDVIIVFGGINDEFAQSDPTPVGDYLLSTSGTMDVTKFKQAYQFLVRTLITTYPTAKVFICSPTFMGTNIFENNGAGISQVDLHAIVKEVADFYGCGFIDLAKCGISNYNYTQFLDDTVHPNEAGMNLIYEKVLGTLREYFE